MNGLHAALGLVVAMVAGVVALAVINRRRDARCESCWNEQWLARLAVEGERYGTFTRWIRKHSCSRRNHRMTYAPPAAPPPMFLGL